MNQSNTSSVVVRYQSIGGEKVLSEKQVDGDQGQQLLSLWERVPGVCEASRDFQLMKKAQEIQPRPWPEHNVFLCLIHNGVTLFEKVLHSGQDAEIVA